MLATQLDILGSLWEMVLRDDSVSFTIGKGAGDGEIALIPHNRRGGKGSVEERLSNTSSGGDGRLRVIVA